MSNRTPGVVARHATRAPGPHRPALRRAGRSPAAEPPPGAAISESFQYRGRVPGAGVVEGKFDQVGGRPVLIVTGTFGFRIYDLRDRDRPKLLDSHMPPEILGSEGYWQDEDMDLDVRRKLIIGSLDPRHDDVDQTSCPGIGQLAAKNRNPACAAAST